MKLLFASVIILIFGLLDLLNPVRDTMQGIMTPVQFGLRQAAVRVKDSLVLFHNISDIRKENLELMNENNSLQQKIVDLKKAEEENSLLRNQLELKNNDTIDNDLLLAAVMGNSEDHTGTSIVLDKGTRHGVATGDTVIIGNSLVGIVVEATGERSTVSLIVSPEVSMTVKSVEAYSSAEGLAQGDLGTIVKVTRLLPSEVVNEGDIFITDGKDGNFLPGMTVGKVVSVSSTSADPLKTAQLEPLVEFSRLSKVFVVLSK